MKSEFMKETIKILENLKQAELYAETRHYGINQDKIKALETAIETLKKQVEFEEQTDRLKEPKIIYAPDFVTNTDIFFNDFTQSLWWNKLFNRYSITSYRTHDAPIGKHKLTKVTKEELSVGDVFHMSNHLAERKNDITSYGIQLPLNGCYLFVLLDIKGVFLPKVYHANWQHYYRVDKV